MRSSSSSPGLAMPAMKRSISSSLTGHAPEAALDAGFQRPSAAAQGHVDGGGLHPQAFADVPRLQLLAVLEAEHRLHAFAQLAQALAQGGKPGRLDRKSVV